MKKFYIISNFYTTDLEFIRNSADEKATENETFRNYLKQHDGNVVDEIIHHLNDIIAPQIDCTKCGNCCRSYMINVTQEEAVNVAELVSLPIDTFKEKYIEESMGGQLIISSIPCHFLDEKKCSIYSQGFSGCREFPHLHETNIQQRLFGLLMYYGKCPIIYNVMEEAKRLSGFTQNVEPETSIFQASN